MKKQITIISLLLIGLLLFSMTPLIFRNYVSAYPGTCAANFLPNHYVPQVDIDGNGTWITLDTPQEVQLAKNTADYISYKLNQYYWLHDIRDSLCTNNTFYYCVGDLQNYDSAVIFSKGHLAWGSCTHTTQSYAHHGLSMTNGDSQVWDYEIFPLTSSKNVNSFIWHCKTAINPDPNPNTCVCRGLPRAFTHDPNIAKWGSSGSQVYLGWTDNVPYGNLLPGGSPQYSWEIDTTIHSTYSEVATLYYYYVSQGYSTAQALSYLSQILFYTSYEYSDLAGKTNVSGVEPGWLVVYGNMYVGLPTASPPYPYVSSIAGQTVYGYGAVNNPNGLKGSVPDGDYVQLYGGNYGDGANIVGQLNTVASRGDIWMYAYSGNGYYTHFYTFVSNSNNGPWTQTKVQTVIGTGNGGQWINCGSYNGNFQYVALAAIDDNGNSANLFVDAVEVRP